MMILVNTDYISGKKLEMLGLVKAQLSRPKMSERISCRALKILLAENLQPIMR